MDLLSLAGPIGAVLSLAALLSAGVVVWRNAGRTQAASIWRQEAEAHKARGDRLEAGLNDLRAEFATYRDETSRRIEHLESENATLRELVTARDAISTLTAVAQQNAEALGRIEGILQGER